jgi:uncharacterized protein YoxC
METILVITQIVALICLSAVCIYVIVVLMRVREVLRSIEKDFKELTTRAVPILENMEFITSRVKGIVRESIGSIKQVALNVVDLERRVQERIEGPILEGVALVAALFKGVRTFAERIRS